MGQARPKALRPLSTMVSVDSGAHLQRSDERPARPRTTMARRRDHSLCVGLALLLTVASMVGLALDLGWRPASAPTAVAAPVQRPALRASRATLAAMKAATKPSRSPASTSAFSAAHTDSN